MRRLDGLGKVEEPSYEQDVHEEMKIKPFKWNVPQNTIKMKMGYAGLDTRKQRLMKQKLVLPSSIEYRTPSPTMLESMPDLAKINTLEETAKSYNEISERTISVLQKTTPTISGPSIGGSAGNPMIR